MSNIRRDNIAKHNTRYWVTNISEGVPGPEDMIQYNIEFPDCDSRFSKMEMVIAGASLGQKATYNMANHNPLELFSKDDLLPANPTIALNHNKSNATDKFSRAEFDALSPTDREKIEFNFNPHGVPYTKHELDKDNMTYWMMTAFDSTNPSDPFTDEEIQVEKDKLIRAGV